MIRHGHAAGAAAARFGGRFLDLLSVWQRRAADRSYLRQIDERLIKDIGASRADIVREARKPFWRA